MSPRILEYYISPCFPCAACLDWPPGRFVSFQYYTTYLLLSNINVYVVKRNADILKSLYVASLAIKQVDLGLFYKSLSQMLGWSL
jgi:hypothetical protein